ncbi:recombinase [Neisseria leonii]|uniref:Recombinase n=1 Tax=Neisseria leonii TaxID=2995413 RepID=A0A9X4IA18_9NEIS|nr:recombinase [Neisseria sp. 51.81]MDD9326919.1 recombinase [Neisseria sp. 51.81]
MPARLTEKKLPQFVAEKVAANQAFELLYGVSGWLRRGGRRHASARLAAVTALLADDPQLARKTAVLLCQWLCSVRLYPLLISSGIFSRNGFGREMRERLYERINPSFKDVKDLRGVFALIFHRPDDTVWLDAIALRDWLALLDLLRCHLTEHERNTAANYVRLEGLYAVEMLSIWVAAEELEPDLIRLDNSLLDVDSPFVALKREVVYWVEALRRSEVYDAAHLKVMLDQCRTQVERLRRRGTGAGTGSSLNVAHLLERLDQTLARLTMLMAVFGKKQLPPRRILLLTTVLARATAEQNSISRLWSGSVRMLSRSITQNTGDHGEHYITRNQKEYLSMLYSAAGGGVLIALMSLNKIYLGGIIDNRFWLGMAEGLNYGLGFALIFMLGFTVATKQPAMTAAHFAAVVESKDQSRGVDMKLAQLLVDVLRSQSVAVFGNVFVAVSVAALIAAGFAYRTGMPLLDTAEVAYQLKAVDIFQLTLWYAAIAGVWLFCSGIISGFFDNRCDYLNLRMRLRGHPLLKLLLPAGWRAKFADYAHENYGSIMGNIGFGMLLGLTGAVGHATGLPLDIRHVAFSSANVGYAAVSGSLPWYIFLKSLLFVLAIGAVNLWVSFSITLWVALRSRETKMISWWRVLRHVGQIARQRPLSLFLPLQLEEEKGAAKKTEG